MAPRRPERTGLARLVAAGRNLVAEQRAVLLAAAVLLLTMLLPWYSRTVNAVVGEKLLQEDESRLAIAIFSFVEAAIFLVALGVALLILARGDRRPFHLPGGDGVIVTIAGGWATFLIFYRFVDKPSGGGGARVQVEYGLSWGIFFGLLAALALMVAGLRLRAAQVAEPVLPGKVAPSDGPDGSPTPARRAEATLPARERGRPRALPAEPATRVAAPVDEEATRVVPAPDETAVTGVLADAAPVAPADPGQEERDRRRREREARRREADPEARPRHDPDSFEPPEFDIPPRPRRED